MFAFTYISLTMPFQVDPNPISAGIGLEHLSSLGHNKLREIYQIAKD